ncbi:unnamed protein product [Schistosoma margrebowiei]|uniref:Uncharacterized protein n=1 Tax=Schistosoma margrebowiei TaxID=48269 RepID=A0A183NAK9_9TREM|nr:unnamed protein product [Schistosoma margrebowiei]
MVAGDQQLVHTPFVPSGSWSLFAPLVLNQGFLTPIGGHSMSTNSVEAPDICFLSSQFHEQHSRHEKACSQVVMKIKNNPMNHNDHDINNNEKCLIHHIDKTNHDNQLKEQSKKSIYQQLINNNNNHSWSISEIGLSLSCLNPNDNIIHSSSNTLSLLSYTSYLSPFNINPFPYIINLQKNNIDFNLYQKINKQILLQIGSYHLPELIRYIQSKKSIWCLQKLNISGPFYNLYFPFIYDIQFSTYLLTLINKLKFSNIIKLILCDLPEIEILNRARIRSHRNQYVKYYINNHNNHVRKDIRFSHPLTLNTNNDSQEQQQEQQHHHHHHRHDECYETSIEFMSSKDNSLSLYHLPHIINVSNINSNENIKIKRNSKDFINFYGIKQSKFRNVRIKFQW